MTAVTILEISTGDFPGSIISGDGKRRALVFVRCSAANADQTLNLATYIPGAADIEGIYYETNDGVVETTNSTWSTTTLTFLGATTHTASVMEGAYIVTFT